MLSVVIVPNLPKNAQSEWHAIAAERCHETKGMIQFCDTYRGQKYKFYIFSDWRRRHKNCHQIVWTVWIHMQENDSF